MDLHRLTAHPRWPQVTSQRGQEGSKRGPWTPQRAPRGPLRTPREAQETPKGAKERAKLAQVGSKMAQVKSKIRSGTRKMEKTESLKKQTVLHWFWASCPPQDGPKRVPNLSLIHISEPTRPY